MKLIPISPAVAVYWCGPGFPWDATRPMSLGKNSPKGENTFPKPSALCNNTGLPDANRQQNEKWSRYWSEKKCSCLTIWVSLYFPFGPEWGTLQVEVARGSKSQVSRLVLYRPIKQSDRYAAKMWYRANKSKGKKLIGVEVKNRTTTIHWKSVAYETNPKKYFYLGNGYILKFRWYQ